MAEIYNLDEGVNEYIEFIVGGFKYKFKHMNSDEAIEMEKIEKTGKVGEVNKYLYKFVTKIDEAAPEFSEMAKKMIGPQWKAFRKMFKAEYEE